MNQKETFWISITIFLTIVAWMILDIYKARKKTTVESGLKSVQTVDYTFNPEILQIIKERNPWLKWLILSIFYPKPLKSLFY